MTNKKERATEFREHRTSWKWFDRVLEEQPNKDHLTYRTEQILLEILKELQYLNDK